MQTSCFPSSSRASFPLQGRTRSLVSLGASKGAGELLSAPSLPRSSQGNLRKEFPGSHHTKDRSLGPDRAVMPFYTTNFRLVQQVNMQH